MLFIVLKTILGIGIEGIVEETVETEIIGGLAVETEIAGTEETIEIEEIVTIVGAIVIAIKTEEMVEKIANRRGTTDEIGKRPLMIV